MTKEKIKGIIIKNEVLRWLETIRLKDSEYGRYKLSLTSDVTIMSSCFAVFVRELFDNLEALTSEQKHEWVNYVKSAQDFESGLFIDPELKKNDLTSSEHNWEYVVHQTTAFALSALDALDSAPDYEFTFLNWYKENNNIIKWLESLNWSNPWLVSNKVMFIMQFLISDYERNGSQKSLRTLLSKLYRVLIKIMTRLYLKKCMVYLPKEPKRNLVGV